MKHLLILLVVIGFIAACKEKPVEKPYCQQNPGACETVMEGKKYFAFGMGSWWVYEEETSGERDSVYVTEAFNDVDGYNFDVRTHSTLNGYNYHYWPLYIDISSCRLNHGSLSKCLYINKSKGKMGDYIGENECFFVNFKIGDYISLYTPSFQENKLTVMGIYPDFKLGDFNFLKTVKLNESRSFMEGGIQSANYFYSKNVGLIRKELVDSNEVWNLVDYHIVS